MKPGKSMQELSEWDELKTFFDRRLIKALGHPVREHILAVLNERIASAREMISLRRSRVPLKSAWRVAPRQRSPRR